MKDYAKLVNTPREMRSVGKVAPQEQPNLVRSAKERQPKEQGSKNTFAILLVLFIIIAVGYGVVHQYFATHHIDLSTGKITKEISQIKKNATSAAQNSVPQFDFYTVLPKGSTPSSSNNAAANTNSAASTATSNAPPAPSAPPTPSATPPAQPAPTPTAPTAPVTTINISANTAASIKYFLNVGDYSTNADAERMLSQLLLLGVQASVAPKQDNGATVYEVLVGPFGDQAAMGIVKDQLSSHQINTVVVQ